MRKGCTIIDENAKLASPFCKGLHFELPCPESGAGWSYTQIALPTKQLMMENLKTVVEFYSV